ncbi:MAG: 2-phosphosulfolactate phosphatase [Gemmatimonadaceae bacterium]|nr:2-phosphosulfolactate phosphatase [Gemmatimonadaceae bacterium]
MQLDVILTPAEITPADVSGRLVAVIDVLRASTSIATALGNGAKAVIPFTSADEAISRSKNLDRDSLVLAGEKDMHPISGFDLGNSPQSFSTEVVDGKTVMLTTTNGTKALLMLQGASDIVIASYVNFSAMEAMLRAAGRSATDITIVCAGREGHFSLEDAACAGRYVRAICKKLTTTTTNDAASACALIDRKYGDNIQKIFEDSVHGKALVEAGFGDDLGAAAALDSFPVVPVYRDRQITRLGSESAR